MNALSSAPVNYSPFVSIGSVNNVAASSSSFCPIAQEVELAMVKNPHLKQRKVVTFTRHGHVTLEGRVGSYYEKQMAQESVRQIEGVIQIDNQLEVDWNDLVSKEWS